VGGAPHLSSDTATLPGASGTTTPTTTAPATTTPTTTAAGPAPTTTSAAPTTTGAKPPGTAIGPARDVPVGGAATFQDPGSGDPALALQLTKGQFVAYDAICPHAGCTVGYSSAAKLIVCPCHGSEFNPANGAVIAGPAPHGLSTIAIAEGPDGQLYAV
jgi:thiosulfate dehydrogenase [quinone] large subunit